MQKSIKLIELSLFHLSEPLDWFHIPVHPDSVHKMIVWSVLDMLVWSVFRYVHLTEIIFAVTAPLPAF